MEVDLLDRVLYRDKESLFGKVELHLHQDMPLIQDMVLQWQMQRLEDMGHYWFGKEGH